jgi:hypothetical protein
VQPRADRQRVLGNLISANVCQVGNRQRAELHPVNDSPRLNRVRIINARRAAPEQPQVAIHGVLVERNEQIDPVTHVGDFFRTRSNRQKSMPAANDGLIGIVGVQVQAAPAEDLCENVTRRGHTLSGRASDTNSEGLLHDTLSG